MEVVDYILIGVLFVAVLPVLCQAIRNVSAYKKCRELETSGSLVSVIIPARNEDANIEKVMRSVLASDYSSIELIVGNDHSTDKTQEIVEKLIQEDTRVKLSQIPSLPEGWGGKMHTCWQASRSAEGDWLLFIDADVTIEPLAVRKMLGEAEERKVPFLSGFPKEETESFGERLLIPMIFFILLGFLSIRRMRKSAKPEYGAACGQVMLIEKKSYLLTGGHSAVKGSCHDGLDLPRMFRRNELMTDLVDLSDMMSCRMYHSTWSTCVGLEKNAKYGMGKPPLIFVFTFMLLIGQVLPWVLPFILEVTLQQTLLSFGLGLAGYLIRGIHCSIHGCSWIGAVFHPLGVIGLLAIQWVALVRGVIGVKSKWKGRTIE